jgi:hypothetical protein
MFYGRCHFDSKENQGDSNKRIDRTKENTDITEVQARKPHHGPGKDFFSFL